MMAAHTEVGMVKFSVYVDNNWYATASNINVARQSAKLMSIGGHTAIVTDTSGVVEYCTFRNGAEIR
jgi:hypothetical protein